MGYDIKLYVHGVPKGQRSWGVESIDSTYIDSFYGRKRTVPVQMFVEVRQFGTSAYSYYTYFVGNTNESDGRAGGYFALTLRINYYYADVRNIYNLLDAAFHKFILGTIVKSTGDVFKYTLSDFASADATLKDLYQEALKYLMQFSTDNDFISLNGFKANGQQEVATINLLECDARIVADHVKNYSSISVSPYYPSKREQNMLTRMTNEMNEIKANAKKQIALTQENAKRDIESVRTKAQQRVAEVKAEKESAIKDVRNQYTDVEKKIKELQQELDKNRKENKILNSTVNELTAELENSKSYKKKFDESQRHLDNVNAQLSGLQNKISGLNGNVEAQRKGGKKIPYNTLQDSELRANPIKNESPFKKFIRVNHPFINFWGMIVLVLIVVCSLPKNCAGDRNVPKNEVVATDKDKDNAPSSDGKHGESGGGKMSLKDKYPNANIYVTGISDQQPMKFGSEVIYTISLSGVNEDPKGEWKSTDFEVENGRLIPKHEGECKISYVVNGEELVSSIYNVVN